MAPGCPSWALSLESSNPAPPPPPTLLGGLHHPESGHWVLQHWPEQYQGPDQSRTRFRGLGTSAFRGSPCPASGVGGWASRGQGVAPPFRPPSKGTQRHLHTFRLARCSPFRPQRFQLLIWKRKKKTAGRGRPQGGNLSLSAARAPPASGAGCRRRSAPSRDRPEPRPSPRPAPSSSSSPRRQGRVSLPDPGAGRGPWGGRERGRAEGGVPLEPSLPGTPPSPEEPRLLSASSVSRSEPKSFCNPSGRDSSEPNPCLQTAARGIIGPIRQTEKLSPRERQFTCSRSCT